MNGKRIFTTGIAIALAGLTSSARANEKPVSVELSAGGGVSGFIEGASDLTQVGGQWDVRARLRTPILLGFEIGYVGTANGVTGLLEQNAHDGIIVGNGFEANLVASLLPSTYPLDPYVFVGSGYTRFTLANVSSYNPGMIRKNDNAFVLPSGAGLSVRLPANLVADARFTYRAVFDDGMLYTQGQGKDALDMSQWGITARLAYVF